MCQVYYSEIILFFKESKRLEVSGSDYPDKLKKMVNNGIKNGNYEEAEHNDL